MVRGRKPTPTALKLVKGEQKSRINDDEPQPDPSEPQCPSKNPKVQRMWDYTMAQLRKMRVVTMADRDPLLAYCQIAVIHSEACEIVDREGVMLDTPNGGTPHPAIRVARDAATQLRQYATEFGLTPASRTRIKTSDQQPEKAQGAGRLLSG